MQRREDERRRRDLATRPLGRGPGGRGPGRRGRAAAWTLAAGLCAAPWASSAGEYEMEVGGNLYAYWCGSCHGAEARGDGPLSLYLTLPVPDLTDLAQRNGGHFPLLAVIRTIDGGDRSPGHGGDMPVFGALFADDLNGVYDSRDAMIEAQGRILSIAIYLSSIQR